MKTLPFILQAVAMVVSLSGCSSQQLYATGQGWQKQECQKILEREQRMRCEQSAVTSYERYQAEAAAAKKPPQ